MKRLLTQLMLMIIPFAVSANELITPIPQTFPYNEAKAALGKKLFFDTILSKDRTIACINCHNFKYGGADPRIVSIGISGKTGRMQSPTVFNAVFNFTQFWNGRAKNLTQQASGPMHNPLEMGMTTELIEQRVNADERYRNAFQAVTGHSTVTFDEMADAISEYEKTLITPNSKFDRFLRGEISLDAQEAQGYEYFKRFGCANCHNGVNIGGNSFQKFGVIVPIRRSPNTDDRYAITGRERDKNVFKVPTLRNIALTAPYFHDGSASTLQDALKIMALHNLGMKLSPNETSAIIKFLHTLTGELPHKAITP